MISECSLSSCRWTWDVRCVCSFVRMYPHTIVYFYIRIPKNLVNVGSSRHKLPRHRKNSVGDTDPSGQNWSDTVCRRRHAATCRRHFQLRRWGAWSGGGNRTPCICTSSRTSTGSAFRGRSRSPRVRRAAAASFGAAGVNATARSPMTMSTASRWCCWRWKHKRRGNRTRR